MKTKMIATVELEGCPFCERIVPLTEAGQCAECLAEEAREAANANRIDGFDRDDIGESPDL